MEEPIYSLFGLMALTLMQVFGKANKINLWYMNKKKTLWYVHKLFSVYFNKALQNSLWEQLIAYVKIVQPYFLFDYKYNLYISAYVLFG